MKKIIIPLVLLAIVTPVLWSQPENEAPEHSHQQTGKLYGVQLTELPEDYEYEIQYSEAQWRKILTNQQFAILRQKGTERPWLNRYNDNKKAGTYYSAATGQALFSSRAKYNSGTGWPSFREPINEDAVHLIPDYSRGMVRIEVVDSLSGSHIGHLFTDGPRPSGLRYCMNSTAMIFVPEGGEPPVVNQN